MTTVPLLQPPGIHPLTGGAAHRPVTVAVADGLGGRPVLLAPPPQVVPAPTSLFSDAGARPLPTGCVGPTRHHLAWTVLRASTAPVEHHPRERSNVSPGPIDCAGRNTISVRNPTVHGRDPACATLAPPIGTTNTNGLAAPAPTSKAAASGSLLVRRVLTREAEHVAVGGAGTATGGQLAPAPDRVRVGR
jgi:hypothetical protein